LSTASAIVLAVTEAARLLKVSLSFLHLLIAHNEFPHVRLGKRVIGPRAALERRYPPHSPASWPSVSVSRNCLRPSSRSASPHSTWC